MAPGHPLGGAWPARRPTGWCSGGHAPRAADNLQPVDTATEQLIASLEALLAAATAEGPRPPAVPLEDWAEQLLDERSARG